MPKKLKSRTLTVFLVKEGLTEPSDILKAIEALATSPVAIANQTQGHIFLQPSQDRLPSWVSLFRDATQLDASLTRNASTAAVWILPVNGRTLALTFGYGRNLLKPGAYEEDFGLRVTLNSVDPNRIKAIDRMTLDAVAQQSRIQASRDVTMSEFGLDIEQDLLTAVTGVPITGGLGTRLTGRDALQVTIPISLPEIPSLLSECFQQYSKQDYKARFPWVEQIHEIDDPLKRGELDSELVKKLRSKSLDGLWLAVPEMMEWEGLGGFKYRTGKNAEVYSDIHVLTFLDEVNNPGEIDDYTLKHRYRIYAVANETDAIVRQWPVYRCLYCEVQVGTDTFLLNNGRWFRIASDFVTRINEAVANIAIQTLELPPYTDKSEQAYSKRVANASKARFALMDLKLIGSSSLPNKVEFCDLFSSERQIVHLKRYSGSSTLSHLFSQGFVSAKLFLNEPEFRRELNTELPDSHRLADPNSKVTATDYEIIFGIISKSKKKLVLPFFSRVNLKNAHSNLTGMGFKVSLCKIQAETE